MFSIKNITRALTGLVLIVLGSLCISKPGPILLFISSLAGLFILVSGVVRFAGWLANRASGAGLSVLFSGLFQILIGLILLRYHSILTSAMGILIIVVGVFYFLSFLGVAEMERVFRKRDSSDTDSGSCELDVHIKQDMDRESEWIDEQ